MQDNIPYHTPLISLAITTYNRPIKMIQEALSEALVHPIVSEIVICDDASDENYLSALRDEVHNMNRKGLIPVHLFVNSANVGMSVNKFRAVSFCTSDWVLLFDSDNGLWKQTLDAICHLPELFPDTIYSPSFASPNFDYREFEGKTMNIKFVADHIDNRAMSVLLNTCNYLVNRTNYCNTFVPNPAISESDTIWFNYLWLKEGNKIHVVKDMHYFHRVHDGSGWKKNASKNILDAERIKNMIKSCVE
ncbi:MAG TPA: hypothetical protein DCF44_06915 [Chitinophagaceae bacterium]|nr:hypothetical protein [Chitinophagaceae bacterium]